MATHQATQIAPDGAIERLLAEIASAAYLTEKRLRSISSTPEHHERELAQLRDVVARLGWMADIALKRLDSENCMYDGNAVNWLFPSVLVKALAAEAQS